MSAPCHLTAPCNELYLVTMFAACLQSGFLGGFFWLCSIHLFRYVDIVLKRFSASVTVPPHTRHVLYFVPESA